MSRIIVDLLHIVHTCPGTPEPHIIDTRRTVVAVEAVGTCQQPRTVRSGDARMTVDCHRVVPTRGQCAACRTEIVIRDEATIDTGPFARSCTPMPAEPAVYPCRVCGDPVVATLADYGAHLLCRRWRGWRGKR